MRGVSIFFPSKTRKKKNSLFFHPPFSLFSFLFFFFSHAPLPFLSLSLTNKNKTGDLKLEWGWQNTSAVVRAAKATPLTAANVLSLGNLTAAASALVANKSAAVQALISDPAKRAAVVTNKTLGRLNTLQRAFNKTRAPLPSVINAATLRATFTDETLHQQVYIWNNQGALGTDAAGGIPTNNSTFYWVR